MPASIDTNRESLCSKILKLVTSISSKLALRLPSGKNRNTPVGSIAYRYQPVILDISIVQSSLSCRVSPWFKPNLAFVTALVWRASIQRTFSTAFFLVGDLVVELNGGLPPLCR